MRLPDYFVGYLTGTTAGWFLWGRRLRRIRLAWERIEAIAERSRL